MKQFLLLACIAFFGLQVQAQFTFVEEAHQRDFIAEEVGYDLISHIKFNNDTDVSQDFHWKVSKIEAPSVWDFFICDLNKCYGPGTVESPTKNTLSASKQGDIQFHLVPAKTVGVGKYKLELLNEDKSKSLAEIILTFNANAVGIIETTVEELRIYPNPVQESFQLKNDNGLAGQIEIFDILGRKMKSFNVQETSDFNVSDLRSGRYFARIYDKDLKPLKVIRMIKK